MKKKKYLIYVDILGFKNKAEEIARKIGFEKKEDEIREDFLSNPLRKRIKEIERKEIEVSKGISEIEGSDNYILIVDDIQTSFEIVTKLTKVGYIPLEIGLDTKEIDEDIEADPINRKEIISFLKMISSIHTKDIMKKSIRRK